VQRLKYAIRFIQASFSLAIKKDQLQEQWLFIAVGNLLLLLIWFLPMGLTLWLIGIRPVGMLLIGLIGIFMLFSFYLWGEITREHASKLMAGLLQTSEIPGEGENKKGALFDHWPDIFIWIMAKPVLGFQFNLQQLFFSDRQEKNPWFSSHNLIIPLISLENLSLKDAISRLSEMMSNHMLQFTPGFIKVDLLSRIVHWVISLLGILTGISVALIVADPFSTNPWQRLLSLGIGILIAWLFVTSGTIFSAFARNCYHTALYQWVMNVQEARGLGDPSRAVPPELIRQSLE